LMEIVVLALFNQEVFIFHIQLYYCGAIILNVNWS